MKQFLTITLCESPVLQIGGQDENSQGVPRIPESAVLLELISDLAAVRGGRTLTPEDPIERGEQLTDLLNLTQEHAEKILQPKHATSSKGFSR